MILKNIVHIAYRRLWFSVNDNFLSANSKLDATINYCIQVPGNINNTLNEFYTLLIDLKQDQEIIWESIYHRTRAEILSFVTNQSFDHKIVSDLDDKQLDTFISAFNEFAKYRNIRKAETFRLKAYNKNKILAVSYIKQNNKFICINFYRVTKQRATNLYSFHLKHILKDEYSASHIGRAHKALHWLDIKEFKTAGADNYDFCGWYSGSDDKELLNINKFKEQFTQNKIKEYSGVIYNNKLLAFVKKFR